LQNFISKVREKSSEYSFNELRGLLDLVYDDYAAYLYRSGLGTGKAEEERKERIEQLKAVCENAQM
jgi:cell division septum initiation protein DivIVA